MASIFNVASGGIAQKLFRLLIITAIFSTSAASVCFGVIAGNVDGSIDGTVDLKDVVLALQICAGEEPEDISSNGKVGLKEAIYALQIVAGVVTPSISTTSTTTTTVPTTSTSTTTTTISGNADDGGPNAAPKYFSVPDKESGLDFGKVIVGSNASQNLSIINTGDDDLEVNFVSFGGTDADDFKVEPEVFPLIIKKGIPQSLTIVCSPLITDKRSAELRLSCNDPEMPAIFAYPLKCTATPPDLHCNLNTFFDIENNRSIGSPGKGYDSDRDRIKSSSCLNGEFIETGAASSELIVDQIATYEELHKKITSRKESGGNFSVANIPFFYGTLLGLSFGKEKTSVFTSEITRKSLSESFVYQYGIRVPNSEFQLDTSGEPLNGLGQTVYDRSQCQFRSTCGDQFVYQIEQGGSLYVALSFDFKSDDHKETFRKTSKGNFGISLSHSINAIIDIIQDSTNTDKTAHPYSPTKSYFVLDIVSHENLTWVCIKDGKGAEPAGSSNWKRKEAPTDYDNSKAYSVGDFVNFEGKLWGCVKECKGQNPGAGSSHWKKFEEPSENDKTDLASIEVNWYKFYESLSEEIKKQTRLTIHAIQIGGNSGELSQIFGDENGGQSASLSCSLISEKESSPCREAISRIVQYASSERFASGINDKPAILNYRYRPYEEAGVFPGMVSDLTDDIIQAREDLAAEFEQQTGDKEDAEFKLGEFEAMFDESEKTELNALINTLEQNLNNLRDSASVCFSNLPDCENSVDETLSGLLPYDKTLLELPVPITIVNDGELILEGPSQSSNIQKYCELPPNYMLTGIGVYSKWGGWQTVKLEGRQINANGTLGTREIFSDGTCSHWIEVPEDKEYVITGIGVARRHYKTDSGLLSSTKDHVDVTALHAWYREFDPVNRKLTGEAGLVIEGGAALEARYLPEEYGLNSDHAIITGVGMGLKQGSGRYGGLKIKVGNIVGTPGTTVTTGERTNITSTSATCGGNVTSDDGAAITARGVCWSSSQNPTIIDAHTTDGTGTGSFTSDITGLLSDTTYYVKAYVTDSGGPSYGNEVSFKTSASDAGIQFISTFRGITCRQMCGTHSCRPIGMFGKDGNRQALALAETNVPTVDISSFTDNEKYYTVSGYFYEGPGQCGMGTYEYFHIVTVEESSLDADKSGKVGMEDVILILQDVAGTGR